MPDDRIRVVPPGVDLEWWHPPTGGRAAPGKTIRLLFVGGDFVRKGGELLLDALRGSLGERFELDIVTREPVSEQRGVRVHRAEANSPIIHSLYERADVFVLPSLAECFGIATVEAMASGLPVIVGETGAGREIVGEHGWVIPPRQDSIVSALEAVWRVRNSLPEIGARARLRAERRFNGKVNDARVVDVVLEALALATHAHAGDRAEPCTAIERSPKA